ncbi:14471_t:CDS:1, partial [Gigaspora margarita]
FTEDALVASRMNLGPDRSVPKMRNIMWKNEHQSMIIEVDYFILYDQSKGIKWVLGKREL